MFVKTFKTFIIKVMKKEAQKINRQDKKRIAKELKSKKLISLDNYVIEKIKSSIVNLIKNDIVLTPPPPHISADMSFSVFEVAKELKQDPKKIGRRISHRHQWATWTFNVQVDRKRRNCRALRQFVFKQKLKFTRWQYCKPLNLKKNTAKAEPTPGKSP